MSEPADVLIPSPDAQNALATLQESALAELRSGNKRRAALALHHSAGLRVAQGGSGSHELAQAARLLTEHPADQALVLHDLGHALLIEEDVRRAALVWQESARLAHAVDDYELLAAARHALAQLASDSGDHRYARANLRASGAALMADIERDFLTTLGTVGNLASDEWAQRERARRSAAVEEELAALKREMGLLDEHVPPEGRTTNPSS